MHIDQIPLDRLSVSKANMRSGKKPPDVSDILPSIIKRGVISPLFVRPNCNTGHFEIVAGESARAIMALTMDGIAIGNGIITVENEIQAQVRADPAQKNKGGEAAKAAIALLDIAGRFADRS